eukprot:TRINITY_DN11417_c0_g1_i1.p1 TRINITY_DN11417_c0_g1~~TRINITY_DN11417_c0_g1_i1.p1  ORF type:complete len:337 (-),score=60.30 TRINITY_DN11417_c0_g1_i1:38-1048(-)
MMDKTRSALPSGCMPRSVATSRRGMRGRSWLTTCTALVVSLVCGAALHSFGRVLACFAFSGHTHSLRQSRAHAGETSDIDSNVVLAAVPAVETAPPAVKEAPKAVWGLHLSVSDHYIWRDEDVFMSIVADAGEWELDTLRVRTAWKEAMESGSAMIFDSAPLYVVKEYVKELKSYGLRAEARESVGAAVAGASVEASENDEEGIWRRRDWDSLPPELKDELAEKGQEGMAGQRSNDGNMAILMTLNDHPCLDGSEGGKKKFRAYVELAADAANKFAPEEGEIDACYRALTRSTSKQSHILTKMLGGGADEALRQFKTAGFDVKTVVMEDEIDEDDA